MNMVQMSKLTDKRMKSIFCTYVVMKGSIILGVIKVVWDGSGNGMCFRRACESVLQKNLDNPVPICDCC